MKSYGRFHRRKESQMASLSGKLVFHSLCSSFFHDFHGALGVKPMLVAQLRRDTTKLAEPKASAAATSLDNGRLACGW